MAAPLTEAQQELAADPRVMRLARVLAHRKGKRYRHLADEFVGVAYLGLVKAAADYDGGHGTKFGTFAYFRVNNELVDYLRQGRPRGYRNPTRAANGDADEPPTVEAFREDYAAPEAAELVNLPHRVASSLETLSPRQKEVLQLHFFEGFSLVEIGVRFGVSRERARQIKEEALKAVRRYVGVAHLNKPPPGRSSRRGTPRRSPREGRRPGKRKRTLAEAAS